MLTSFVILRNCAPNTTVLDGHHSLRCFNGAGIPHEFRDEHLLNSQLEKGSLNLYYKNDPPTAQFITEHPSLKRIVRVGLLPAAVVSTIVANPSPAEIAIVGLPALT